MVFHNSTHLDSLSLEKMLLRAAEPWPHDGLNVFVRYSRKTVFSGTCCYRSGRIYVNLGRDNQYPVRIPAAIARPQSDSRCWWREIYSVEAADAYQLVLFVFMHELYHWLVKKARRNVRQKEARCDRFAARALVDGFGGTVRDARGRPVPRSHWDFQDLDGFVAAALGTRIARPPIKRAVLAATSAPASASAPGQQLLLFG